MLTILRIAYGIYAISLVATAAWYALRARKAPPVALVVFFVLLGAGLFVPTRPFYRVARVRNEVFHHTDHGAVLAACRDVMREAERARTVLRDDAEFAALPQAIRDLHPLSISIGRDRVVVALAGSWFPFGLYAYPPGSPHEGGSGRLIEGLWFYAR